VRYHSDAKIEKTIVVVVIIVGFLMLLVPLWILEFVVNEVHRLAIISGFMALFLFLVSSVTVAKAFETLAATAA